MFLLSRYVLLTGKNMISLNCQNNNQKNKPNFSANIKFSNLNAIKKSLEKKGIQVSKECRFALNNEGNMIIKEGRYTVESSKRAERIGTLDIYDCNAGGITGGNTKNNLVFHLLPSLFMKNLSENLVALEQKFRETVSLLKKEKIKPQGLIFGGDTDYADSKDLLVILKYFFDKFKIKPTVFWGTSGRKTNDYHVKNIFYKGKTDNCLLNLRHYMTDTDLLEKNKVLNAFDYVRVSPKDKVKFSDTGWISGKDKNLRKGKLDLSIQDVLRKYGVDPKILESL